MQDENIKNNSEEADDVVFDNENETENPKDLIKNCRRIKELEQKNQEYLTGWQKERADSINLRKKMEEEKKFSKFAKEDISTELISVLDSFDSAFKNKEAWGKGGRKLEKGVEYIHSQLINVLANPRVSVINPLGEKFDPQRDEA